MTIGCLSEKEEPIILCQEQHKNFLKSNRRVHELKTSATFQNRLEWRAEPLNTTQKSLSKNITWWIRFRPIYMCSLYWKEKNVFITRPGIVTLLGVLAIIL